jgi:hypothetical protein
MNRSFDLARDFLRNYMPNNISERAVYPGLNIAQMQ